MKKTVAILTGIALAVALASCGGSTGGSGGAVVDTKDAEAAVAVSLSITVAASMMLAFGAELEGAVLNSDSTLTFDNFDLTQLAEGDSDVELPYVSMSGTVAFNENAGMTIDVTFEGGPVNSLMYEIDESIDLENLGSLELTATVNGRSMNLVVSEETMSNVGN
jgi:hypothetical protein